MYHLARSLYLQWTSKPEYSIILLGLDNAGKTTLMSQIKAMFNTTASSEDPALGATGDLAPSSTAGNTVPTVGQNVATIDLPDMYIKIWDVGGQLTLRRLWSSYYKNAHAIVFIVDSTDLGSGDVEGLLPDSTNSSVGAAGGSIPGRGWIGRRKSSNHYGGGGLDQQQQQQQQQQQCLRHHSSGKSIDENTIDDTAEQQQPQPQPQPQPQQQPPQSPIPATPLSPSWTVPMSPLIGSHHHHHHSLIINNTNLGRLEECKAVLESVLSHEDTAGIPILVLANKQDREDCLEVVTIKEGFVRKVFEGSKGGMVRDSRVLPVSALKGTGVKEAVDWVKSRVLWNKEARPPLMR